MCRKRLLTCVQVVTLAILCCGWSSAASPADQPPPWKPFAASFCAGSDGKPIAVMITPGATSGSWVMVVGGTAVWQLTPLAEPVPPTPGPTPPPTPAPILAEQAKRLALEAAQRLPAEGRAEDAQKLAAVYKTLADQIPATIDSIDKLITANRYAREIALGPTRTKVWEPPHWEAYPHHQFLHTVGALPCCGDGGCWKSRCQLVHDGDAKDLNFLVLSNTQVSDAGISCLPTYAKLEFLVVNDTVLGDESLAWIARLPAILHDHQVVLAVLHELFGLGDLLAVDILPAALPGDKLPFDRTIETVSHPTSKQRLLVC